MALVLVVNAGSTSLKLTAVGEDGASVAVASVEAAPAEVVAVAHRVVHGGARREAALLDTRLKDEIREASLLAPLHNRPALDGIERAERALPGAPHVAVFDTAFHATLPPEAAAYAVPRRWRDEWGIRRYGFHGLSVAWCAERAPALAGRPLPRLVVCHLGGGCSVTAVRDGRSVDTTMGFSPLDGVPMATRAGSIDPGALLYLLRTERLSLDDLDRSLEHESGLRGLSGRSGDVRELEAAAPSDPRARFALDVYTYRIACAVSAMTAALGGLDALVFTGGVGERSARVRERVTGRLRFLGAELDSEVNQRIRPDAEVSARGARARVLVVSAREDVIAARAARALLPDLFARS